MTMELERIAAAVNFDEHEHQSCDWAVLLAKGSEAQVKIVNVLEAAIGMDEDEYAGRKRLMTDEVARVSDRGVVVSGEILIDRGRGTAGTLIEWADGWKSDVIVLGNHPRKGLAKLFDNSAVAQRLVEGAHCPILLVMH